MAELRDQLDTTAVDWIWLDFHAESQAAIDALLDTIVPRVPGARAHFHDASTQPRFEHFDGADSSVWTLKGLDANTRSLDFRVIQIAFLLQGAKLLVTRHTEVSPSINGIMESLWDDAVRNPRSALEVALMVSQRVFDRYVPIVRDLEGRLDELEEAIFANPKDQQLQELTAFRTRLKRMRRFVTYHTAALERMDAELENPDETEQRRLRIARDTLQRLMTLTTTYYDMCGDLIDGFVSIASHRMNQIMKLLTMVTVIFVPLSFIAGLYGMNFEYMPELGFRPAYFIVLGIMLSVGVGLLFLFRWKRWF